MLQINTRMETLFCLVLLELTCTVLTEQGLEAVDQTDSSNGQTTADCRTLPYCGGLPALQSTLVKVSISETKRNLECCKDNGQCRFVNIF